MPSPLQLPLLQHGSQIKDRPKRRSDGDPIHHLPLVVPHRRLMANDAFPSHNPTRRAGDVRPFSRRWQKPPKPPSRPMTQHSPLPCRKHSRHPSPPPTDPPSAEHVDATENLVQL